MALFICGNNDYFILMIIIYLYFIKGKGNTGKEKQGRKTGPPDAGLFLAHKRRLFVLVGGDCLFML